MTDSESKRTLETALRELETVKEISWVSEHVICITLKYPAGFGGNIQILLAHPTIERAKEKIRKVVHREIGIFIDPSRYQVELIDEQKVRRDE